MVRKVPKLLHMNPIKNLNLKGYSFIKRSSGPTMLIEKELICVENCGRQDDLSLKQQRNPQTVSQLLAQVREFQDEVNCE